MPITLNHSNINVQYSTGSNYIIETVKSDLYIRDSRTGISSNLTGEPTVIFPSTFTESVQSFPHSGGDEAQTSYTITVGRDTICDVLVVGGGGGGGAGLGSGGGAGGLIYSTNLAISAGTYNISVGKGGTGAIDYLARGSNGNNSSAFGIIAYGGGGGAGQSWVYNQTGLASGTLQTTSANQGSGAGGTRYKGIGNSGTAGQGNSGGNASPDTFVAGGGGGAGSIGGTATNTSGGIGGTGLYYSITGTSIGYAGGGAGMGGVSTLYGALASEGGGSSGTSNGSGAYLIGQNGINGKGGGGGGGQNTGGNGGSGIVIIKFKSIVNAAITEGNPITHKTLNFAYDNNLLKYDFTNQNTEATWKAYAATIPNFTYSLDTFLTTFDPDAVWTANSVVGWVQMTLPSTHNFLTITYGLGAQGAENVKLLINGVLKSSATSTNRTITYSQAYNIGDVVRIEETFSTMSANFIFQFTNTNIDQYTLNFPVPTTTDILERTAGRGILNNSNLILHGTYDINLTASSTTIVPRTGQYLPFTATSNLSQNIGFRYHLLNPIKMPEGAQWTYSSNNANVYHLGNVGIGTTNPSYNLDVSGNIFTSTGGYTQSGLTTWTVMSDRRIKENIVKASYDKCLENVKNIKLYSFNFKDNCVNTNDKNQLGFIAQEVQQVYPKAVEVSKMTFNTNESINNVLTLNTTQIDYTLYGAVKELINKVEMLETKINM